MGPIPYHTVIGVIKGTEFPDEYVIMGGHLDAYDVGTGATDNGSGVAPSMEAARLIMKAGGKPKRSILVTLWSGEEFGLYGSTAWLKDNANKLDNVSASSIAMEHPLYPHQYLFLKLCNLTLKKYVHPSTISILHSRLK